MKILSLECSAIPCSVAVIEDGKILANAFSNVRLTHSQTLMPMVESVLNSARLAVSDIDAFAVTQGPGSFTGVRIGISAVKGLAQPEEKPCVGVSALHSMAVNYSDSDCFVCAVMDARCNQVYNALFENNCGSITRLCEDRALSISDLSAQISTMSQNGKRIYIVGDGAELFYSSVKTEDNVILADEHRRYQNAVGVGVLAEKLLAEGKFASPSKLEPLYLRLPQAERELKRKEEIL